MCIVVVMTIRSPIPANHGMVLRESGITNCSWVEVTLKWSNWHFHGVTSFYVWEFFMYGQVPEYFVYEETPEIRDTVRSQLHVHPVVEIHSPCCQKIFKDIFKITQLNGVCKKKNVIKFNRLKNKHWVTPIICFDLVDLRSFSSWRTGCILFLFFAPFS